MVLAHGGLTLHNESPVEWGAVQRCQAALAGAALWVSFLSPQAIHWACCHLSRSWFLPSVYYKVSAWEWGTGLHYLRNLSCPLFSILLWRDPFGPCPFPLTLGALLHLGQSNLSSLWSSALSLSSLSRDKRSLCIIFLILTAEKKTQPY